MISALKRHWQQRAPREQLLLLLCGSALLLLLLQQAVLRPLQQWQQQQQQALQRAERDLRWIKQQQPLLAELQQQQPQPLPAPLAEWLPKNALTMKVNVRVSGNLLTLPAQPVAPLLSWLNMLERRYGLQPAQLMLRAEAGGLASGELSFVLPGSDNTTPAPAGSVTGANGGAK